MGRAADSLSKYKAKRDFAKTPEPKGRLGKSHAPRFVVQKHAASRLHYDFRLEMDGVLKSWAVTRGPSADPEEKRLAVRTEDHPIDYGDFEGVIPKGQYGGGTVMLWDQGTWAPQGDPTKGLAKGKLHFVLHGKRMKGEWVLVRMKTNGEKHENWLLRKVEDAHSGASDNLIEKNVSSVTTGRSMNQIAHAAPVKKKAKSKLAHPLPKFRDPQLATLVEAPPIGENWLHEMKYDGYRCMMSKSGERVIAYSRKGLNWSDRFTTLLDAIASLPADTALIDGEAVAMDEHGRPDFSTLQKALKEGAQLSYFAFDLLHLDGEDLTKLPLIERKAKLERLFRQVPKKSPISYSTHVKGGGEKLLSALCAEGYEGIVSKEADAPYRSVRTRSWLKTKCGKRQEFVIAGYTPSERRDGFASLVLGVREGGKLRYAGRVGTGFDGDTLNELGAKLEKLRAKEKPFDDIPADAPRKIVWVKPRLIAEVEYGEMTASGAVRHASFVGLREDKSPKDIVRETPKVATPDGKSVFAGVTVTHPDRVLFEEQGVTKGDLAAYYEDVADKMLEHSGGRLLSLVRCPEGPNKACFFQKHYAPGMGDKVKRTPVKQSDGVRDYLSIDTAAGLIACVQMGVLEFHIWGSHAKSFEQPDRIAIDLDPDEGLDFGDVREAAKQVRALLKKDGLTSFPMVTGGKGVHVVAPLSGKLTWPQVKKYAQSIAVRMETDAPERFVATMSKAKRKGRIFVDWLRNDRGATAIAPFSTRARQGAPIAMPVSWPELAKLDAANTFSLADGRKRTFSVWRGYDDVKQSLPG